MALALVFGHFALPFALLLSRDLKRNFKLLSRVALFILFMRLVDLYWEIAPEFHNREFGFQLDGHHHADRSDRPLAGVLPVPTRKRPLMPLNNPHLEEALQHGRE